MTENSKFKVGDKVIAVEDTPQNPEGWIGYITNLNPGTGAFDFYAQAEEGGEEFAFDAHELELLRANIGIPNGFDSDDIKSQDIDPPKKTKSDGGSSSYYELTITNKAGESIKCETGDVIRALVGNDFDFGNCVKALRRMYLATLGMGKEGTDIPYDCNKVRYFLSEIERVNK